MSERATTLWHPVRWHDWDALRCVAGECEAIVGVSAGPRVLSLRWRGGENLLHRDRTGFGVGEWRMFGGHRLSTAPESVASYVPDNASCRVWQVGGWLHVEQPAATEGLRRALALAPTDQRNGFSLQHTVRNVGAVPWRGALWAITCVPPHGRIVSPCEGEVRLWGATAARLCSRREGHIITTPNGTQGKAGWHSAAGWLALLRDDATFLIQAPGVPPRAQCVDGGCNLEVFCCADWMEMETLGAEVTLAPGECAEHVQRWWLGEACCNGSDATGAWAHRFPPTFREAFDVGSLPVT